ncbi:hypothetical protein C8R46DRAFT_1066432 [Mycena filopes]|nr:hypothetical protein C8R46DRAFT_1066432 [Mycena filopes]
MAFLQQSFLPVYSELDTQDPSMIIGGTVLYLKPGENWPTCATCSHPLIPFIQLNVSSEKTPAAFKALIPSVASPGQTQATMLQLFVCPEFDCYDHSTIYSTDTRSWLVRIATVPLAIPPGDLPGGPEAREKIIKGVERDGTGFLPRRVVETWIPGKEETLHHELSWGQDETEEFYAAHEPEEGLKLLGHTVRGKYYCADDECPQGVQLPGQYHPRRELLQLGDRHCECEEDDPLGVMSTLGNTWIEQCIEHPEVVSLTMSGNW